MSTSNSVVGSNGIFNRATLIRLVLIWSAVVFVSGISSQLNAQTMSYWLAGSVFVLVLFSIVYAAFGVVKEADALAHKLGEPYGTLILTLSIVSIEVILIAAVMLGPAETATIGKDSIFSVMMIIMNLVIGLCILCGGLKYGAQSYNSQGSLTYMAMIIMLGGMGMMLPNFITGAGFGEFSMVQAGFIACLVLVLYSFFLYFQMKPYSYLYVQPAEGEMEIAFEKRADFLKVEAHSSTEDKSSKNEILLRTLVLILTILPIVLLSHHLAVVVDFGISEAGLPAQLGGILIAIIVFTPESMTAVKAALNNEFQRVINLCHGAFVSTVGLTIPCVLIIGLISGKQVLLGLSTTETILFVITLLLSLMTFSGKKTTPFIGIMHLALFAVFLMLVFFP